ncbi:MAG TPA: hypothetical protein VJ725_10395 [Thermoanaerobaculia bacterium]|nr:hypothetical protein [Thermoanaerobaculia bacterium]
MTKSLMHIAAIVLLCLVAVYAPASGQVQQQNPPTSGGSFSGVANLASCQSLAATACSPGVVTSLSYNETTKQCTFRCGPKPADSTDPVGTN